jgi:hypothetical protein
MTDDLAKRLRKAARKRDGFDAVYLAEPAANRIEELEVELATAVEALEYYETFPLGTCQRAVDTLAKLKRGSDE